jgi:Ca-activated chloride channel family protein
VTFVWPLALVGLVAIPLLVGLYVLATRRRRQQAAKFANPALVPNLVAASPSWRRYVPPALALVALACLVVGIARPHVVRDVTRDEATVVLAIDTSRSMAASDVQPNRFEAAKQAAQAFLDEVPDSYAVGIVAFSTSADPVLPPTTDRDAARVALAELRLGSGTALGNAIIRSVELALGQGESQQPRPAPQQGEPSPAAVLLLSDGAQTSGDIRPLPAAQRARRFGVPVSTVALGTSEAVVEVPRPGGLKERVTVAPDLQALKLVANTTGGTFSEAPTAARLESVYRELGTRLATDRKRVEVTSAFAAGGAILLLLGSALSSFWFRRAL